MVIAYFLMVDLLGKLRWVKIFIGNYQSCFYYSSSIEGALIKIIIFFCLESTKWAISHLQCRIKFGSHVSPQRLLDSAASRLPPSFLYHKPYMQPLFIAHDAFFHPFAICSLASRFRATQLHWWVLKSFIFYFLIRSHIILSQQFFQVK